MRTIIKIFVVELVALYLASQITRGLVFESGTVTFVMAAAGLAVATLIVRPLINILILPINLLTFGLFKWVSSAIALYLVTMVVPGFSITGFTFLGFFSKWIDIPSFSFSGVFAYVAFSFLISLIYVALHWLIK